MLGLAGPPGRHVEELWISCGRNLYSSSRITCLGGDDRGVAGAAAPHCHDWADLGTQAVSAESQQPKNPVPHFVGSFGCGCSTASTGVKRKRVVIHQKLAGLLG